MNARPTAFATPRRTRMLRELDPARFAPATRGDAGAGLVAVLLAAWLATHLQVGVAPASRAVNRPALPAVSAPAQHVAVQPPLPGRLAAPAFD